MSGTGAHRANRSGLRMAKLLQEALDQVGDECPQQWRRVAEAKIKDPEAPWSQIAGVYGMTKTGAHNAAHRLLALAGLPKPGAAASDAAVLRRDRRARENYGPTTGYCPDCQYQLDSPGHKIACGEGDAS